MARGHFSAGRLAECEGLCRRVLDGKNAAGISALKERTDARLLLAKVLDLRGQSEGALAYVKQAAAEMPERSEIYAELGRMYLKLERWEPAAESFARAAAMQPDDLDVHLGWGKALLECGDYAGAASAFERVVAGRQEDAAAIGQWAEALRRGGRAGEAVVACRQAIERGLDGAEMQKRLGAALNDAGHAEESLAALARAVKMAPVDPEAAGLMGEALRARGAYPEAIVHLRAAALFAAAEEKRAATAGGGGAAVLSGGAARRFIRLGNALLDAGRDAEATEAFGEALARKPADVRMLAEIGGEGSTPRKSAMELLIAASRLEIKRDPGNVPAWFGLGVGYQGKRNLDAAVQAYRGTLKLFGGHTGALNNLALAVKDQGEMEEAVDLLKRSAELREEAPDSLSNYLYALHFDPRASASDLRREHARFQEQYGELLGSVVKPHENERDPDRRLRVGYVSPNFCEHPVGRFLAGFFPALDHGRFEIFCYSSVRVPDEFTGRIKACADHWEDCRGISDAPLAAKIRADRIDILVDLTMHMAHNRMMVFVRKPAPVQISYLAYCSLTGLHAIDWRITDPFLDPPGGNAEKESWERPLHLPETYWCYEPGGEVQAAEVVDPPALVNGFVTFGSFNNFCKVTPAVRRLWGRLLSQVAGSKLIVHAGRGTHREKFMKEFETAGIARERIAFFDFLDLKTYFALHGRVDIALDTFPYPGGTTTCDALWMGVPTVSLAGEQPFMRAGVSILSNVGLAELAAFSEEEYLKKAAALAGDLRRLTELRRGLRDRMKASPLMDAKRFVAGLESCYRKAWRGWCDDGNAEF